MKERITFDIYVHPDDPEMAILIPNKSFQGNSVYEIKLPEFYSATDETLIPKQTLRFITEPENMYIKLEEVMSMAQGLPLKEEDVLFHIREACREANYLVKRAIKKNIEVLELNKETIREEWYEMYMFIKLKSLHDCIKQYYVKRITEPYHTRHMVSDLQEEDRYDLRAIRALLDDLEEEMEEWEEKVVTLTADPKWALRGKFAYPIHSYPGIQHGMYHKTGLKGYNRGY